MKDNDVSEHARALALIGAQKGGQARAAVLSKGQRQEIARIAAETRWKGKELETSDAVKAICGSPDHPLVIGDLEIPCYVLEGEKRVLVQRSMIKALGMSRGSSGGTGGDRLAKFIAGKRISEFVPDELRGVTISPIRFITPHGGLAYGYEATVLADICEAVLAARKAGQLQHQQDRIADQCEILMRGFARVGIIALVDEVTGYQYIRARRSLEQILKKFISEELQRWVKTFPDEFYEQLFKLRGWDASDITKRPGVAGRLTVDIVYKRLAPAVIDELYKQTPRDERGRLRHRLFQRLTPDYGHPRLREHLSAVIALMKATKRWDSFYAMLNRALPQYNATLPMLLDFKEKD